MLRCMKGRRLRIIEDIQVFQNEEDRKGEEVGYHTKDPREELFPLLSRSDYPNNINNNKQKIQKKKT